MSAKEMPQASLTVVLFANVSASRPHPYRPWDVNTGVGEKERGWLTSVVRLVQERTAGVDLHTRLLRRRLGHIYIANQKSTAS